MPTFRLSEIATRIGARLEPVAGRHAALVTPPGAGAAGGDADHADPEISGVSGIREALPGQISFLASRRYQSYVASTHATALIVGPDFVPAAGNGKSGAKTGQGARFYLRVDNAYMGFVQALRLFGGDRPTRPIGIHPTAVVASDAQLGADVSIGPHVVIESGARIGDRTVIMPGCFVGLRATLGDDVTLWPNVTVREGVTLGNRVMLHPGVVIGSDGFGFAREGGGSPQDPPAGHGRARRRRRGRRQQHDRPGHHGRHARITGGQDRQPRAGRP